MGPKVVGSDTNEVYAFNYIMNHLNEIKTLSNMSSDIEIDHQIVSGFNKRGRNYRNVQNIVVKVQGETNHALICDHTLLRDD
jgi:hypothetical protein